MSRSASFFVLAATALTVLPVVACNSSEIPVGRIDQQLQTRQDGQPTGNGQTCSWEDTVAYGLASGEQTTPPAPSSPYQVGERFKSLDGCNDCSCTEQGIMCTVRTCSGSSGTGGTNEATEPGACPALGCQPKCSNGTKKDANGCDTCECADPICPALGCQPKCSNGTKKDANGCDTCQCA